MIYKYISYGSLGTGSFMILGHFFRSYPSLRLGSLAVFLTLIILTVLYILFAGKILDVNDEISLSDRVETIQRPLILLVLGVFGFILGITV